MIDGLFSFGLTSCPILRLVYTGRISIPIFRPSSPSCLRAELAHLWSLNGNTPFLEKELTATVERILPKAVASTVVQNGSKLAHLYGLPKTHKRQLAVRPILSATGTYNYKLAKWLDEKLKPLSVNDHTISDVFNFVDSLHDMEVDNHSILVL